MQKVTYILFITIFLTGCSGSRKSRISVIEDKTGDSLSGKEIVEKNLTKSNFYIQKAEVQFDNNGERVNLLATLKYQNDGKYLISVRTRSGLEVVRILLDKDTILANDRVNKKLYRGSTLYLESKYGISLKTIPVILGDYIFDNTLKEEIIDCNNGKAVFYRYSGNKKILYQINCKEKKVEAASFNSETGEGKIEIRLSGFTVEGNYLYPGTSEIIDNKSNSEIKIDIKKIEFNTDDNLKFIPGNNYEEILLK